MSILLYNGFYDEPVFVFRTTSALTEFWAIRYDCFITLVSQCLAEN